MVSKLANGESSVEKSLIGASPDKSFVIYY